MDDRTDAELVALARFGDKDALGHLVERYQHMAKRVAMGVVAHEDIARELAQEAMLQAYLSLDRLRDVGRFQSWLYGIVLNVCRRYLRDQQRAPVSLEAMTGGLRFEAIPFTGVEPDTQEVAEARELHKAVLQAVNTLSPKNRAATLLFYYEQLSLQEIAATLGVSVAAVKGRLHKARSQLRERLSAVYSEMSPAVPQDQEERSMVKVTIADVVHRERKDKEAGKSLDAHVIVLMDEEGRRLLPIWIGQSEGQAIAIGLREFQVPRPLTHSLMGSLLKAAGAELEEVRVEELKDDTYYAVAKIRVGDIVREVDARPSDAIALAVQTGSPIYAAEEVMKRAGKEIPEDVGEAQSVGKGLDGIIKDLEKQMAHGSWGASHLHEEKKRKVREEFKTASEELIPFVFGAEGEETGPSSE